MEENTRVKKYAKLRDDIAKMDDNSMYQTPYQVPSNKSIDDSTSQEDVTAPIKHVGKRTRSLSLDDIFAAHDQYSSITGQDQEKDIKAFEAGVTLDDGYETMPAQLKILESGEQSEIELTIHEGKFHQVKRMFESVGKKVVYLKRLSMGKLMLGEKLGLGEYRELTDEEVKLIEER